MHNKIWEEYMKNMGKLSCQQVNVDADADANDDVDNAKLRYSPPYLITN